MLAESRRTLPAPELRGAIVPNPVDTNLFCPSRGPESDTLTVLFVGRLEWWKGPDIVAEAIPHILRTLPNVRFTFVGSDGAWSGGQRFSDLLQSSLPAQCLAKIRFLASVSHDRMPDLYRTATVVVVPSRWEGFGFVCAEAMACGRPVVASRVGGLAELIEDGVSGLLVTPEDPNALADALIRLLRDKKRRQQMGQAARRRAETMFSHRVVVPRTIDLYRQVMRA